MKLIHAFCTGLLLSAGVSYTATPAEQKASAPAGYNLFARTNLVAWCIVPFDARKRNSEERAQMMDRLQLKKLAYDYRAEHISTFDTEVETMKRHGIEVTAWWFPTVMNDEARLILDVIKRQGIKPQLWVTGSAAPVKSPEEQKNRVKQEVARIKPIADAAAKLGCKVGLYNHGGWFGEPENQIEIIESLGMANVGIVYNLHHGHDQVDRFPALLKKMKPHLLVLNLNGMVPEGDQKGKKIVPIGQGELDPKLLKQIKTSGWHGPIGILNHTEEDAEKRLKENLEGLEKILRKSGQ